MKSQRQSEAKVLAAVDEDQTDIDGIGRGRQEEQEAERKRFQDFEDCVSEGEGPHQEWRVG